MNEAEANHLSPKGPFSSLIVDIDPMRRHPKITLFGGVSSPAIGSCRNHSRSVLLSGEYCSTSREFSLVEPALISLLSFPKSVIKEFLRWTLTL